MSISTTKSARRGRVPADSNERSYAAAHLCNADDDGPLASAPLQAQEAYPETHDASLRKQGFAV